MLYFEGRGLSAPENQPAQLELFERRLPTRPYCTDRLESGLKIRPAKTAVRRRYIQADPPWLRAWLIFDVDRPTAAMAWDEAFLPEPAWVSQNPVNGHAHLAYGLDAPVLLGMHDRDRPKRYLAAVERAMREQMTADPGYSVLITKNPPHKDWRVFWGAAEGYDLGYLAEWLPDLNKHKPRQAKAVEREGLGRNVSTFDHLRFHAYREVRLWRDTTLPPPGHLGKL